MTSSPVGSHRLHSNRKFVRRAVATTISGALAFAGMVFVASPAVANSLVPPTWIAVPASPANGNSTTDVATALTADGQSGSFLSFASNTPSICTVPQFGSVSGNSASVNPTYLKAGNCGLKVQELANNGLTNSANTNSSQWTVVAVTPVITFSIPSTGNVGDQIQLSATSSAPPNAPGATPTGAFTYSIPGAYTSNCSVSGSQLTLKAIGSCIVDVNEAAAWPYASVKNQPSNQMTISGQQQTITFSSPSDGSSAQGGTHAALVATSTSTLPVTFSIDGASTAGACSLDGTTPNQVDYLAAGTCKIDANQAGNGSYAAAPQVQNTITITGAPQTINFTSPANNSSATALTHAALVATAPGGTVTFSIDPSTSSVCHIDASNAAQVDYDTSGTCKINANQSGGNGYLPAAQVQHSVTVTKASQTITFSWPTNGSSATATTSDTLVATAPGGTVTFSIDPASTQGACSISGGTQVNYLAYGTCLIDANQSGNATYLPAPQVQYSVTVNKASQTITWASPSDGSTATATTNTIVSLSAPGGVVTLSIDPSSTPNTCQVDPSNLFQIDYLAEGTCVIDANQGGNQTYLPAPQVTHAVTVTTASQTIDFTSPVTGSQGTAKTHAALIATASSGLTVAFSIDPSSTAGACEIDPMNASQVDYLAAGSCVIDANQPGNTVYGAAAQVPHTVTVMLPQTITFTSPATNSTATATNNAALSASSDSGLTVTFSIDPSSDAGVCKIDLNNPDQVDYLAGGTCLIDANQPGNSTYQAATQVQHKVTVNKASQTITFNNPADGSTATALQNKALVATSDSNLTVTFSIDPSSDAGVCKIDLNNPDQVDYLAAGTCLIDANQTGNATYLPAKQVQNSITVNKASQTITFSSPANGAVVTSVTNAQLTATASSGLTVTFSVDPSSTPGACAINAGTAVVEYLAHGTCVIDADQAGNQVYSAASQVQHTITIKDAQTITFSSPADGSSATATDSAALTATTTSGLTVTFSIDQSSAAVCKIDANNANQVDYVAAGTCLINADQAGNGTYLAAPQVQNSVTVNKATQTITFTSPADGSSATATHNAALTATSDSSLPVSFSIDPSSASVCAIDVNDTSQVDYLAQGTCVIDADQAGNGTYAAATTVAHSITVNKAPQTITFNPALTGVATQNQVFTGTASSGLSLVYVVDGASTGGACQIDLNNSDQVDYLTAGTCVIDAFQSGNSTYAAATPVQATITIAKAPQTISFTMPTTGLTGTYATLLATASSNLQVTFTVDPSSTAGACSITNGNQLNYLKLGTCKVDANQAGNATYAKATQVQRTATVKSPQTITFFGPADGSSATATQHAPLTASATSNLTVTFSVDPSSASVCKIDGTNPKQVDYLAAGSCVIDANQAGNATYAAAPQVQHTVTVNKASQTITFTSPADGSTAVATHHVVAVATASSGLPVALSIDTTSSTAGACMIDAVTPMQVDYLTAGTCVIDANQVGNATYAAATQVQHSVTIAKATQTITLTTPTTGGVGQNTVLAPTASSTLPVTLTIDASSGAGVCQIDVGNANQVDYLAQGTCVVDANQSGNATYLPAAQVQKSIAVKAAQTIIWTGPSSGTATQSDTLVAKASSGLTVTYSVDAHSGSGVCSVSGTTVKYLTSGTCIVDANQAGDASYAAAPMVPQTITVSKATQTITFTLPASSSAAQPATLTGSSTSGLPLTYATLTPTVCTVSGTKVTYLAAGTCTLTADQAGNATYAAAQQAQASTMVVAAPDALTFPKPATAYAGTSATLKATDLSGEPITYSSSTPAVCSVTSATVHYLKAGTCSVQAAVTDDGILWIGNPSLTRSVSVYALPVITTGTLFHGTVGKKLTIQLTYRGGIPNVKPIWKVVSGHPPAGFRVVGDPTYTGTPKAAGTYKFVMSLNGVVRQTMTIVVAKASGTSSSGGSSSGGGVHVPSLPDTGGPDLWLLWLAGGLFALGGLVLNGRRRRA